MRDARRALGDAEQLGGLAQVRDLGVGFFWPDSSFSLLRLTQITGILLPSGTGSTS